LIQINEAGSSLAIRCIGGGMGGRLARGTLKNRIGGKDTLQNCRSDPLPRRQSFDQGQAPFLANDLASLLSLNATKERDMRTNRVIGLGALALGVVLAAPAFAQGVPQTCVRFQQACSDPWYPVSESATAKPLYNMATPQVIHRHAQKTGTVSSMQKIGEHQRGYGPLYNSVPQESAVRPCVRVQTFCL
jgi:hypothetical protein